MRISLSTPKAQYDAGDEAKTRKAITDALAKAYMSGEDIELWPGATVVIRSPDGNRWRLSASNAGVLTLVAA